jgi:hypothetical protein
MLHKRLCSRSVKFIKRCALRSSAPRQLARARINQVLHLTSGGAPSAGDAAHCSGGFPTLVTGGPPDRGRGSHHFPNVVHTALRFGVPFERPGGVIAPASPKTRFSSSSVGRWRSAATLLFDIRSVQSSVKTVFQMTDSSRKRPFGSSVR